MNIYDLITPASLSTSSGFLEDNIPFELVTSDGKNITIEYNSETKQLVIKTGANTLKSRLVN
jgi:hypothetical protein